MMTAATTTPKPLPISVLPRASVVVGGRVFPVQIRAAAFQGGILETEANITKGSWIPLKLLSETPTTLNIHILEAEEGKMIFRLYGTHGLAREVWEQLVHDLRESRD